MDNITYTKPELGGELLLMVLALLFIATLRSASLSIGRLLVIDVVGVLRGFPDCRGWWRQAENLAGLALGVIVSCRHAPD
jgi:hypothetical protein